MSNVPPVNLDLLHDAILEQIQAQFPANAGGYFTCDDYPREAVKIPVPAFFLDLEEGEFFGDIGTMQLYLTGHFEGIVVVSSVDTKAARRQARSLAMATAHFINGKRWGHPVSAAEVSSVRKDAFRPELDRYEVWRIEWTQRFLQGVSLYAPSGEVPETVMVGIAPYVGPANLAAYQQVVP